MDRNGELPVSVWIPLQGRRIKRIPGNSGNFLQGWEGNRPVGTQPRTIRKRVAAVASKKNGKSLSG
jgi:hypothetical protein